MEIPTEYVPGCSRVSCTCAKLARKTSTSVPSRCSFSLCSPATMIYIFLYHYYSLLSFIISFLLCSLAAISCHFSKKFQCYVHILLFLSSPNYLEPTCFVVVKKMSSLEEMRVSLGKFRVWRRVPVTGDLVVVKVRVCSVPNIWKFECES